MFFVRKECINYRPLDDTLRMAARKRQKLDCIDGSTCSRVTIAIVTLIWSKTPPFFDASKRNFVVLRLR